MTDPNCGFKFGTSGDEIIVDCCQDEAGVNASTPIITTTATVTRNADVLTYPVANLHATKNTVYHEYSTSDDVVRERKSLAITGNTYNRAQWIVHSGLSSKGIAIYGTGSSTVLTGSAGNTITSLTKAIMRWENGSPGSAFVNGIKLTNTTSNVDVTPTIIDIGTTNLVSPLLGNVKNVRIWPNTALTDAQCIQLTS